MMTYRVVRQDGRAIPGLVFRKRKAAKACVVRLKNKGNFLVRGCKHG